MKLRSCELETDDEAFLGLNGAPLVKMPVPEVASLLTCGDSADNRAVLLSVLVGVTGVDDEVEDADLTAADRAESGEVKPARPGMEAAMAAAAAAAAAALIEDDPFVFPDPVEEERPFPPDDPSRLLLRELVMIRAALLGVLSLGNETPLSMEDCRRCKWLGDEMGVLMSAEDA